MADVPVTVRMYDVGFGDAFLVTVGNDRDAWRMVVDCGVHPAGRARHIDDVVTAMIADLPTNAEGDPYVDVVVASHHHDDHIIGFANSAWDAVHVGEVWLPWVEDVDDPQAVALRRNVERTARRVSDIASRRLAAHPARGTSAGVRSLRTAKALADNALGNPDAMRRLRGTTRGFVAPDNVRFLPRKGQATTVLDLDGHDARVYALGPSRDEAMLKRMDPPKSQEWLVGLEPLEDVHGGGALFGPEFHISAADLAKDARYRQVRSQALRRSGLEQVADDSVLLGASKLEDWCNNASLFLVLEVGSKRLVFPGDSQQGAWEFALRDDDHVALLKDADFYKISHHGSHNGTPRRFVDDVLGERKITMLPYGEVKQFSKIPKQALLDELALHHHRLLRADAPKRARKVQVAPDGLWQQVTL